MNIITSEIFDWSNAPLNSFTYLDKTYQKPKVVNAVEWSAAKWQQVTGQDIQSYQENLSLKVSVEGSYGFFSGSVSTEFNSESITKSESQFSRGWTLTVPWALTITLSSDTRQLLNETFRNRLDNLNADDTTACKRFFTDYGTHILTGIAIGGTAMQSASTNKRTVDHTYSLDVVASQSLKFGLGQASASEQVQYSYAVSSFNFSSSVAGTTLGGNPSLGGSQVFSGNASIYNKWVESVIDYPVFVDFMPANPFLPIWELCADDSQGQKVRTGLTNYYNNTWAPDHADGNKFEADYIDALSIIRGGSSTIKPPEGYTKVGVDLNQDAGGDWIYLCYHKASYRSNKPAILDLKVIWDSESTPSGYTKLPTDLNAGAGGKYIYLCYKSGSYDSDKATLDVTSYGSSDPNAGPPYGYIKINRDLNADAGGKYVYIAYARRES